MRFFDTFRPRVFAHRGGCHLGPENTLGAFDAGLAAGADGLELDVHLSADEVVVVHHDDTLDRTTAERGPIARRRAAELSRIAATRAFTGARPSRDPELTGIPTLETVLTRYADVRVIIEMKVDTAAMGLAVARLVERLGAVDRVCAAGFGRRALTAVRNACPGMATSAGSAEVRYALYRSWVGWPVRHVAYGGYQVPEHAGATRVVSRRFIEYAHRAGLEVQIWTVDTEPDMRRLLSWGADALISNRPDLAVRVRDEFVAQVHDSGSPDRHDAPPWLNTRLDRQP